MHYPEIDRIIFSIGPLDVHWYGLAYLAAFACCWLLGRWQMEHRVAGWSREQLSDLVFYGAAGAVLGGRLGYTLFYATEQLVRDPLFLLRIWEGGMSFHGGFIGALTALWVFGRRKSGKDSLQVTDFVAPLVPIGLGLGRLGNFANTELPGRATDAAWGLIYPCAAVRDINPVCTGHWETFARHPSSLYQAFAEGLVLFALVWLVAARPRGVGVVSGVFAVGYGALRFVTEYFREPDAHIGYIAAGWFTMGQLLSLPLIIVGILLVYSGRKTAPDPNG
ncbi:MAG: prolipoprotein diacylglyceryl transferase [Pseudomonadales bacterium]|nr:prolipoprotein diacylglyceryl transferase [Pseudomonadales bacterium]MDP6469503.1 prolipoprotein diacylglyceryl transferase [Pseudomonadales bacterium]MDP6827345.1 prolipoprotein diacylglyceryl transferase [Pseudomonadales bacterium]MDP6971167.1 prolipoprotein diacylglyceryl transferase [Pseudomonadales bacterium]